MDLMMHLATGLFIQQCRFNPQHDAESEQQLYNALPYWLHQKSSDQNSLILELQSNTTVHTAKMPRESLANNFAKHFKSISQQIAELAKGEEPKILLSSEFADLPGFTASLGGYRDLKILPAEAISTTTLHYRDHIAQSTDQIQLINSLPLINSSIVERNPEPTETLEKQQYPTHILIGSNAIPLSNADLLEGFGQIEQQNGIVYLDSGKKEFLLNQNKVVGKHEIRLGDQIVFPEGNDEIRLIQVNNG
jgi:hypothetical protein